MYAIASLLDPSTSEIIQSIWKRFEANCGLTGILAMPIPHISWVGAESFHFPDLERCLQVVADEMQSSIQLHTAGIGIFTGSYPVVYVSVVKDSGLINLHQKIWDCAHPYAVGPNPYYGPTRWMPHITLALRDFDVDRLGCAVADIANQQIEFDFEIDHLAIIHNTPGQEGIHNLFSFQNGEKNEHT